MPTRRLHQLRSEEGGFALIEVLISALIVVLITAAVVQTLTATGRASTEQRHRSQAFSVAQEDQARLRAMQISSLQQGLAPRTVTVEGTPFQVTSTATYVSDKTGATTCGGEGKADYVQIGSAVTWPTMPEGASPILIESIVSPTSGSVDATAGGLAVLIKNGQEKGVPGFRLSASGPAVFSGTTNYEGCALFGGEPSGKYMVTPTPPGTGWVDPEGNAPKAFPAAVAGGVTTLSEQHFDRGGKIKAIFSVRPKSGGANVEANADSILTFNSEVPVKPFGTAGGKPEKVVETGLVYPFSSSYSVWGGSCAAVKPETAAETVVTVPAGTTREVMVRLPALYLTVKRSSGGTTAEKTAVSDARVTVTDLRCRTASNTEIVRTYKTTAIGSMGPVVAGTPTKEEPGLPTGEYEVCVSKGNLHVEKAVTVQKLTGTSLALDLASGTQVGEC